MTRILTIIALLFATPAWADFEKQFETAVACFAEQIKNISTIDAVKKSSALTELTRSGYSEELSSNEEAAFFAGLMVGMSVTVQEMGVSQPDCKE